MNKTKGYAGNILEINLGANTFTVRGLSEDFCHDYLGGIGFNARIVYDEVPAGTDPLGPDNVLVFGVGTMVGSTFPTSSRTEVSAKSPMTGRFGTSNSGMFFGTQLKNAGFDALVVKGRAEKPVYILIDDGDVKFTDATRLWGKDSWDTLDILKKQYPGSESATIGPAGEKLVRFACIENGYYDAWARTGLGAVMGSKNLKAVVVRGTLGIVPHDPEALLKVSMKARQQIESSPFYKPFRSYGSMNAALPYGSFKALNANNFSQGCLPDWKDNFAKSRVEEHTFGHVGCQSCIVACAHWVELKEGKYKGLKMKGMEVTPTVSFGSGLNMSLEACVKAAEMGQRYGMDMVSAAGAVGMAIELYKKGIIKQDDIGDDDAILKLMDDIAYRRGIGNIFAEGTKLAGGHFSGGSESAMHIKGLEIPMIDPRGRWATWTLGILTNVRGGDHLRCRNPIENLRFNENLNDFKTERFGFDKKMYDALDMPEEMKSRAIDLEADTVDIAVMSTWAENLVNLFNSVGVCIRPPVEHRIGPTILAEAYTVFTGIKMTPIDIMKAAERAWNLMKLFNIREGEKPEDSSFPRRYYKARGWDEETGKPGEEKLKELGLKI
jgi:aldehyde:ferredoxin oxidoreductase